ncbi:serine aminopeptidase domain-containing protein [Sphingomonas sp.]|uniref:alpha/beta hydrolase family protein n=3 Tax=Bacteria TaxID=2 RepID=UPI00286EBBA6|nr:alpha/beta hydrolase [Sphingomonas sp.]
MPVQRLIGGGMRYDDAHDLHRLSGEGIAWQHAAEFLGQRNIAAGDAARHAASQRDWYRYASACFRFGQAALPTDDDRKRRLHALMVESFALAAQLDDPVTEKHDIAWRDGKLCGWLMRPAGDMPVPVVMIFGGFDGWREDYTLCADQLVRHGIAAFLVDGPGQGETRLRHGLYLGSDFVDAFRTVADHLLADPRFTTLGVWGNSLGGTLATWVAASIPAVQALCVNGGTIRPAELPERYPRFWSKVEALTGSPDRAAARAIIDGLDLSGVAADVRVPFLQLHGTPDTVFLLENAREIYERVSSLDKRLLVWADGDHCIYNHSEQKNLYVADWFADRLIPR